jgi:hypothetical protein
MLFLLLAAILGKSKRQPPGCCVFSPRKPPRVLTTASWFPLLRVPSSGTISSSPNGAEPCLLLLPVGLRPSSSAAFPSSGRQWRPLLRLPNCRAILLRRVSGTARRGIVSTLVTLPRTTTMRRFGLANHTHSTSTRFLARWWSHSNTQPTATQQVTDDDDLSTDSRKRVSEWRNEVALQKGPS